MNPSTEYSGTYDKYWENRDRIGESSGDMRRIASLLVSTCGLGKVLDIGCGEGALVGALLESAVDASGVDVSDVVLSRASDRFGKRFTKGSVLNLPFTDNEFQTVVSTDCMEHLEPADVPKALAEMHRVAARYVFLQLATTVDRDGHWHLTIEKRDWWERQCFNAGFRKHPAYYSLNPYESLNSDPWQIFILLEKVPTTALEKYPLSALEAEAGLHMDMSRVTGERSDAHMIRYHWSSDYIRPGDRVLDAACGLGYGTHLVAHQTMASEVLGIDASEWAIDYARLSFSSVNDRVSFVDGMLPACLEEFPEASFDVILSFETLEHVEDPAALLAEFSRLLTPGGRVIVSVPNDWSDETGDDPNPFHLQVYNWDRLAKELSAHFLVEDRFILNASQVKVSSDPLHWQRAARSLRRVDPAVLEPPASEWCLMTAMRSPMGNSLPYKEIPFANVQKQAAVSGRSESFYSNPWLAHSVINIAFRMRNASMLDAICNDIILAGDLSSNDYGAALCVKAYMKLENGSSVDDLVAHLALIDAWTMLPITDAMHLRWRVSLLFVKAKMLTKIGNFSGALDSYQECCASDIRQCGVHLSTKITEAFYQAGRISYSLGRVEQALQHWSEGLNYGEVLLRSSVNDIAINPKFPNLYNTGDGIREYALAWDYIARCANGIHLIKAKRMSVPLLDGSFTDEYARVQSDLKAARSHIAEQTAALSEWQKLSEILKEDLVQTRQVLIERTHRLEEALARR